MEQVAFLQGAPQIASTIHQVCMKVATGKKLPEAKRLGTLTAESAGPGFKSCRTAIPQGHDLGWDVHPPWVSVSSPEYKQVTLF